MSQLSQPQARAQIKVADSSEVARMARRPGEELFAREDLEDQLGAGPLILDGLRRRPHYFDGRFLTGADLTRDQDYVRQRQADMARSGGSGVIQGLEVGGRAFSRSETIRIRPGVGLTPSGDVVMLTQRRDVPLLDLPLSRQLDAAMGLREEPRVPLGRRTGLFILALRAVEFTANPIAAYPRTLTGKRTVEDGDIIEATAITLIPFPDTSGAASLAAARRNLARQIFAGEPSGLPQDALPLALLAIEKGSLRWIDSAMVRRETGADSGVQVAFGGRPRALSEAHLLQHRAHLGDVLDSMLAGGLPPVFPAAQAFSVLPPAGQLPAAAVQPDTFGFRQLYFPPSVDVDIAFVPQDEIGALVEESLALPPIDLEAQAAELDATGVLVMIPVTRARYQRFAAAIPERRIAALADPAAGAAKPAFDMLELVMAKRRKAQEAAARDEAAKLQQETEALKTKAWHAAFHEAVAALPSRAGRPPLLWYIRRRTVAYQTRLAGVGVAVTGDDVAIEAVVNANLARLKLERRVARLNSTATPQATARLMSLLGSSTVASSDILTAAVISDLELVAKDEPSVMLSEELRDALVLHTEESSISIGSSRGAIGSEIFGRSRGLSEARRGMERRAVASASARSTASNQDTPLNLSEGEVLDIAQDYSDPRLGEGLARLDRTLGQDWPEAKDAIWLGGTGKALAIDKAFRSVPGDTLPDFAELLAEAVKKHDPAALDSTLAKMA